MLDERNEGIIVTAIYEDGTTEIVEDFTVKEPKVIKVGENNEVIIQYMGIEKTLIIEA